MLNDERLLYRRRGIPWISRVAVLFAALVMGGGTLLLIPFSEHLRATQGKKLVWRPVETAVWQPPPIPPKPLLQPKPPPPVAKRKPEPVPLPKLEPLTTPKPPPQKSLRLPVKLNFNTSDFSADFALDFTVDQTVEEIPEVAEAAPPPAEEPAPPPAPVEKDEYEMAELDQHPKAILQGHPVYPYRARTRGIQGYTDVEFVVDIDGKTSQIRIVSSSPKGIFDRAAERAVSHWRFKPGIRNQKAVPARMRIRIRFNLDH